MSNSPVTKAGKPVPVAMPSAAELLASTLAIPSAKPGRAPSPVPSQVREAVALLAKRVHKGEPTAAALTIKKLASATGTRVGRLMSLYRENLEILKNGGSV